MDMLLKGVPLQRTVGSDAVRITSLGNAKEDLLQTDEYGRIWQLRTWSVPYSDSMLITMSLPTPDGFVLMLMQVPTPLQALARDELTWITQYVYFSYEGTLKRWQEYLAQASVRPELMRSVELQIGYGKGIGVKSPRFQLLVPAGLLKIDADTRLILKTSFFPGGDKTVWDIAGVYLADGPQRTEWIDVLRRAKPPASLPEEFTARWRTMTTAAHPYDSVAYAITGAFQIESVANLKDISTGKSDVGYTLTVTAEGVHTPSSMKSKLETLAHGLTVFEH
jgi:hypothetical protein